MRRPGVGGGRAPGRILRLPPAKWRPTPRGRGGIRPLGDRLRRGDDRRAAPFAPAPWRRRRPEQGARRRPGVALFVLLYLVAGAGNGLENVACDTLIGRTVSPSKLGRVFGTVYGPIFLADAPAAAAGGLLLAATSPRVVFVVAGVGVLAVVLLVRAMLPRPLDEADAG